MHPRGQQKWRLTIMTIKEFKEYIWIDLISNNYMSQLERELAKLEELAPRPVDYSFALGYLTNSLPFGEIPNFRPALRQLLGYLDEFLITPKNVLELLVILKVRTFRDNFKGFVPILQNYGTQLVCDNSYLFSRFFERKPIKEKEKQGLGVECSICIVQIDTKTLCMLTCSHMYHRQCFNQYSREQITKKSIPLRCPTEQCGLEVSNEEIHEFLSRDLKEKYDDFMFQNYVEDHMRDTSWCPTPGCKAVFTFDEGLDNYKCPSCKKHYCLNCKCEMHVGVTCEEYQSMADMDEPDRKFMILVKGSKFKQCPNCKFWVEKNQGCDHMTCRCKYQFCYVCGGKYGACACVGGPRPQVRPVIVSDDEDEYHNELEHLPGIRPMPEPPIRRPVMRAPPAEVRMMEERGGLREIAKSPRKLSFQSSQGEQQNNSSFNSQEEVAVNELKESKEQRMVRDELLMEENYKKELELSQKLQQIKPRFRVSPEKEEEAIKIQKMQINSRPHMNLSNAINRLKASLRSNEKKQQKN